MAYHAPNTVRTSPTATTKLVVNYEHNAEAWWDAARERFQEDDNFPRALVNVVDLGHDETEGLEPHELAEVLAYCAALPGWACEGGPPLVKANAWEGAKAEPLYRLARARGDGNGWLGALSPKRWTDWYDALGRGFPLSRVRLSRDGAPEGEPPAYEGFAKDMPAEPPT